MADDDPWEAFGEVADEKDGGDAPCTDGVAADGRAARDGAAAAGAARARDVALLVTRLLLGSTAGGRGAADLSVRRVAIAVVAGDGCDSAAVATTVELLAAALQDRGIPSVRIRLAMESDRKSDDDDDDDDDDDVEDDTGNGNDNENQWLDLIICVGGAAHDIRPTPKTQAHLRLVPGGVLLAVEALEGVGSPRSAAAEDFSSDFHQWQTVTGDPRLAPVPAGVALYRKRPCRAQTSACPWLHGGGAAQRRVARELDDLAAATVPLSAHETTTGRLTKPSVAAAARALTACGYCILPGLLWAQRRVCRVWGRAVLEDLCAAAAVLRDRELVDLYRPGGNGQGHDPATYRELSMREDCRMDVRDGPRLRALRAVQPNATDAAATDGPFRLVRFRDGNRPSVDLSPSRDEFFRGHGDILTIVGHVMNPKAESLYRGNFGRHNFSGSGPDGSFQDLRLGPVGGIVSLPGAADQALHADAPHLFEHLPDLPAHYINAFTPGCEAQDAVGQTAFVHGSHRLDVTARYFAEPNGGTADHSRLWQDQLVRPRLELGDVLLFDCRILHFGLANTSADRERPLLYTNMTMHWFQDPKNWDNERRIFED